jgi:hypothetical protein
VIHKQRRGNLRNISHECSLKINSVAVHVTYFSLEMLQDNNGMHFIVLFACFVQDSSSLSQLHSLRDMVCEILFCRDLATVLFRGPIKLVSGRTHSR